MYFKFKYKRRVYKSIHIVQKNINSKINIKKFVDLIRTNQISKVARYLEKGFDPNFHISDDGKNIYFNFIIKYLFTKDDF